MIDEQAPRDANGDVTLLLGPASAAPLAKQRGWTFMLWSKDPEPMLIIREVLPASSFVTHSYTNAPALDLSDITSQALAHDRASLSLGTYAVQGTYCSQQAAQSSGCGS